MLGLRFVLVRLRRHSRARTQDRAAITSMLAEQVGAVKLIRAFGEEERQLGRLTAQLTSYRKKVLRTQRYSSLTTPMSEVFGGLLIILIIAAATQPALVGGVPLTPEAAIAFLVASLQLMPPIKSLSQYPASMAVAMASAERVYALLDEPVSEVDAPGSVPARFTRDIVVRPGVVPLRDRHTGAHRRLVPGGQGAGAGHRRAVWAPASRRWWTWCPGSRSRRAARSSSTACRSTRSSGPRSAPSSAW